MMFLKMGRLGELFTTTRGFRCARLPTIYRDDDSVVFEFRSLYAIWSPRMPPQEAGGSIENESMS